MLVGLAAILLMAVVFAQPVMAGSETYTSIVGLNDMTATCLTNASFEAPDIAGSSGDGQFATVDTYTGWTKNSGSSGSRVWNPTNADFYGSTGNVLPDPLLPNPGAASSAIPPVGFTPKADGSQVLATWKDAFIAQTVHNVGNTASNYTTALHQTYVMTWEFGTPMSYGNAWGFTVGLFYSNSSAFMQCNNDTSYDPAYPSGHYPAENNAGYLYQYAYSFATDSCTKNFTGKSMTIRLGGGTTSGVGYNVFDNIHLYGPVPEPSTVALLVTGALGMLAYAWRRKRRK
jgi:hypothetical protein